MAALKSRLADKAKENKIKLEFENANFDAFKINPETSSLNRFSGIIELENELIRLRNYANWSTTEEVIEF